MFNGTLRPTLSANYRKKTLGMGLQIVSVGYSVAPTNITNEFLASLSQSLQPDEFYRLSGIESRSSALHPDYLQETGNTDFKAGQVKLLESPTELGTRAAFMAIERAGIAIDDIGMVIGDTITSIETCPAEGQRIAGKLGLKIPAHDIATGGTPFAIQLDALRKWKPSVMPRYVLLVCTNTLTQTIDYQNSMLGAYFGDGAGAIIVSMDVSGKYSVVDTHVTFATGDFASFDLGRYQHLQLSIDEYLSYSKTATTSLLEAAIKKNNLNPERTAVVCGHLDIRSGLEACEDSGISANNFFTSVPQYGDSLGGTISAGLVENEPALKSLESVVVLNIGGGLAAGYVVLTPNKGVA